MKNNITSKKEIIAKPTACITGAASGLGFEFAKRLASEYKLVLLDLRFDSKIKKEFMDADFHLGDITDLKALEKIFNKYKAIDLLIHCAGMNINNPFDKINPADYRKVIEVNLLGSFNVAKASLNSLAANAHLVLVASMAGLVSNYSYAAYSSSKFGIVGLASVLRIEYRLENKFVSVVCPPEVVTPMIKNEASQIHPAAQKLKMRAGRLTVEEAVTNTLKAIKKKRFLIIPGRRARFIYTLLRWLPLSWQHKITDNALKELRTKVID